jgi:hypothetical protein
LGLRELQKSYTDSVVKQLKGSKIEKLVIPTPKSYEAFAAMKPGSRIETLPSVLLKGLDRKFIETTMTVAYHPACGGEGEFDRHCLELLGKVPGLKVITMNGVCGDTGWKDVNSKSRDSAMALLGNAEKTGAAVLIAGSTRCASHLRAVTGGWNTSPVRVEDIYGFLASRLGGDS